MAVVLTRAVPLRQHVAQYSLDEHLHVLAGCGTAGIGLAMERCWEILVIVHTDKAYLAEANCAPSLRSATEQVPGLLADLHRDGASGTPVEQIADLLRENQYCPM